MIDFRHKGSTDKLENFLRTMSKEDIFWMLDKYARDGVAALAAHTPVDSGLTASEWGYEITIENGLHTIVWLNRNVVSGHKIAILLQYGHGTGTGGYVQGRDFINPAIMPIFDRIAEEVWKAVISA